MSLQIIDAEFLAASYSPREFVLRLYAKGHIEARFDDFQFVPVPIIGGLKYELEAFGRLGPTVQKCYCFHQDFIKKDLKVECPSGYVIVVTKKGPTPVPIRWLGFNEKLSEQVDESVMLPPSPSTAKTEDASTQTTSAPAEEINRIIARLDEPFFISRSFPAEAVSVKIGYDKLTMKLLAASISGPLTLAWQFVASEIGLFTVGTVVILGGVLYPQETLVEVVPPNNVSPTIQLPPNEIESFLACVVAATNKVREYYPDAQLLKASAALDSWLHKWVTDVALLRKLLITYNGTNKDGHQGTITIQSLTWGEFAEPVFHDDPIVGLKNFDPTKVKPDITSVGVIKKDNELPKQRLFKECTLVYPFGTPDTDPGEPAYEFECQYGIAAVGANNGKYEWRPFKQSVK